MLETKQLQYFVTAAESNSFSEAALALYSSQSNVSKVIGTLETQLGYTLFNRESGRIQLNARGKMFYQQVLPIVESLEQVERSSCNLENEMVRISTNSSSWFAKRFSKFYELHENEQIKYNIHTDATFQIVQRVRKMTDDVGFVYVYPEEYERFKSELKRYELDFIQLGETPEMLYWKTEDTLYMDCPRNQESKPVKLIQAEMDLSRLKGKTFAKNQLEEPPLVAVTTNSDYIMNVMMNQNGLANISPRSFMHYSKGNEPGKVLLNEAGNILYGALIKRNVEHSPIIEKLIRYIEKEIQA